MRFPLAVGWVQVTQLLAQQGDELAQLQGPRVGVAGGRRRDLIGEPLGLLAQAAPVDADVGMLRGHSLLELRPGARHQRSGEIGPREELETAMADLALLVAESVDE